VVHTPQFNGKQEEINAMRGGVSRPASALISNLRCPRNGKRTNAAPCEIQGRIQFSSSATERFEHALGKAMRTVPSARIPANKVNAPVFFKKTGAFVTLMHWRGSR
jgi:hypothetical protein